MSKKPNSDLAYQLAAILVVAVAIAAAIIQSPSNSSADKGPPSTVGYNAAGVDRTQEPQQ